MRRICVVGSSGSGKSTLAETIAERTGGVFVELDELMHGPDWTPTPTPQFRASVIAALGEADSSHRGWAVAGNYRQVADLVQGGADTIVWLDLPRRVSTWRLVKRSLRRVVRREQLWSGNRESLRDLLSRDPERNVVLWSWNHHDQYREIYETYAGGDFWSHATVHRLRTPRAVDAFVDSLPT